MKQASSAWDLKAKEWDARPSRTGGDCIIKHDCCNTIPHIYGTQDIQVSICGYSYGIYVQSPKDSNHPVHVPY